MRALAPVGILNLDVMLAGVSLYLRCDGNTRLQVPGRGRQMAEALSYFGIEGAVSACMLGCRHRMQKALTSPCNAGPYACTYLCVLSRAGLS